MPGLGGAVLSKLGALPVGLPPSEIFTSLKTGVIDATEFLGPFSDSAMGFHKAAKYYYSPGYLLLELRSISGRITQHVKTTKDKYGEVALNCLLLNQAFKSAKKSK